MPWVRDQRCTRIADQCARFPTVTQELNNLRSERALIVFVIASKASSNCVLLHQNAAMSSILTQNEIHGSKYVERAQRYVGKISDRGSDDVNRRTFN
jgi:hypothetical protein